MSVRLRDALVRELGTLRYEPIEKRIRGVLGDATTIDSTRAMLVWEPRRVVPTYAFPVDDIDAEIAVARPPAEQVDTTAVGVPAIGAPRPVSPHRHRPQPSPRPRRARGIVVAESTDPYLLFEPPLPVRYHLPPQDVRTDLLSASETTTVCAYKGSHASYRSLGVSRTSPGPTRSRCARRPR
jgi:uncharacterized protein (DUF427 family)